MKSSWWVFALVSLALFMSSLDNLVVTTALPAIQHALHASLSDLEWIVNAYTLVFTVLMIPATALGDRLGHRRVLLSGVLLFTLGSVAAALSPDALSLAFSRAVQGLGGACITPLTLTMLARAFVQERRALAIGLWSGISGLGITVGPLVGGAIVNGWSWNAVFWINVPLGILLVILGRLRLPEFYGERRAIDLPGGVLIILALLSLILMLSGKSATGWHSAQTLVYFFLSMLLLISFFLRERLTQAPMIDLKLFAIGSFSAANAVGFLMSFGMFGSIFFITQFLQNIQHISPFRAGLETLPWTGSIMLVAPVSGALIGRVGARSIVLVGMLVQALALIWIALAAGATVPYIQLLPSFLLSGVGMGLAWSPLSASVIAAVQEVQHGQASSISNTVRELGGVFGISVLGTIFQQVALTPGQFLAGFRVAVLAGAVALLLGASLAFWLAPLQRSLDV